MFLALKHFRLQCQNQTVLVAKDNSTVVAHINKQGGTHSVEMCALLWRIMSWCHRFKISLRARHLYIPGCLNVMADSLINSNSVNGVVSTPSGVQKNLHKVVHTSAGSVCHSAKPQVATICLSSSRSKRMEHGCSTHKLVKPCSLCLPSNSSTSKSNTNGPPNCLLILIVPGMPWFWDLVCLSVEIPLQLPASPNLLKQLSNQVFHNNPQYLNLHAWCLGVSNSKNKVSLLKW